MQILKAVMTTSQYQEYNRDHLQSLVVQCKCGTMLRKFSPHNYYSEVIGHAYQKKI